MTQTVPATCVLGPGKTGLTIGLRVLNADRTVYAAFSTTNIAETGVAGTYSKAGGVVAPLAGGHIVWGTAVLDLAEATVESAAVNVTAFAGVPVAAADADGYIKVDVAKWKTEQKVVNGLQYMIDEGFNTWNFNDTALQFWKLIGYDGDTLETLSNQIDALPTTVPSASDNATAAAAAILVTPANKLATTAAGEANANLTGWKGISPNSLDENDNVPTGALTAQETRDAAKLAPTAGAPAAGSVDKHLDDLALDVTAVKAVTDTLDVSAVTQVAASSAGHLTITAGLTFSEAVTGLTIPADWAAAIWTLKYSVDQLDVGAVIQLRAENPAAPLTDGLLRINGALPATPITLADGSLTVTQASGRIDIWLSDELTALLSKVTGLGWDVKFIDADDDSTGRRGTADVVLTETKAVA